MFFWYWPQTDYQKFTQAADPSIYTAVGVHFEGGLYEHDKCLKDIWENQKVQNMIAENYDYIVIQEAQEISYEEKDSFYEYTRKFDELARNTGAELILFMNWPEEKRWEDLELIEKSFKGISSELGVRVAPVGLAFQLLLEEQPDIDPFFDDGELASKYGDYLAMCVIYATITGKSPVGVDYTGYLSIEEASILQQIAWDTVQDYQD
jgi:hypothetical protein